MIHNKCVKASFALGSKYNESMRDIEQLSATEFADMMHIKKFEELRYNAGKSFMDLVYGIEDYEKACEIKINKDILKDFSNTLKEIKTIRNVNQKTLMTKWSNLANILLPK